MGLGATALLGPTSAWPQESLRFLIKSDPERGLVLAERLRLDVYESAAGPPLHSRLPDAKVSSEA